PHPSAPTTTPPSLHDALPILLRRPGFDIERSLANVVHDANNLPHGRTARLIIGDPLANRVFVREILPGQRLIDHGHSGPRSIVRSEEHTSELQSRVDLVCRLL